MRNLPRVAQLYLVVCYLLGLSAFGWLVLSYQGRPSPEDWLLGTALAVLAALAQIFVVARAGTSYSDHLTPAPLFAAFLLLPRPLLALAVCLAFLPEWLWYRRKWFIQTFNIAIWLIALALGRWTLFLLGDHFRLERAFSLPAAAILVTIPVVLGTQTLLLALALKLARGQSFRETGLFVPTKLFVEVALLCAGWAFATAWLVHPLYGLAAAVPMALIFQALHVPNLLEEASTDPKTGLANMRHFNDVLVRDLERADRSSQPLSLLMCDLDYLRNINNTYGHQAGDIVLRGIADIIRHNIRGCDVAGRFGGEEFVVLLADTDGPGARRAAERLRRELELTHFAVGPDGLAISATISIGVATFPGDGRTPEALMREADLAVYQAKREGRNRVAVAGRASRELAAEWASEHLMPGPRAGALGESKMPFWRFINEATRLSAVNQRQPATPPNGTGRRGVTGETDAPMATDQQATLPLRVALFIGLVVGLGLVGLLVEPPTELSLTTIPWGALGLFAGLVVLAQHLAVDIDNRGKTSVSAVAVLGASFLYGELGILTTVLAFALWAKLKAHSPLHRMLFNFGNALVAAESASRAFRLLADMPISPASFDRMILPAGAAGLVYYVANHLLLCLVRGLDERRTWWHIWRDDYRWLWPHYIVLGVLGLVVAVGHVVLGWTGVLALMAPVAMMHVAIKQYVDRTTVYVEELRRMNARLSDSYEAILLALTRALDTRDEETEEHSQRVRRYSELIARRIGMPEDEMEHLSRGALLHDIGKIGVPDAILLKPGPLTEAERAQMRKHPAIGYSMIAHIPFLAKAAEVVLHHHEGYDGSGYPSGLAGEQIPLAARIFAVADAFDAMTRDRPYRKALPPSIALAEIDRCHGTQFDPRIVDALHAIPLEELLASDQEVGNVVEQPGILFRPELQPVGG